MMRRLPAARRLEPRAVWTAGLILLAAAALWFHDLNGRALWWDEIGELLITRQNLHDLLVTMSALPGPRLEEPELAPPNEPHPPLFPLSQHAWIGLMGTSDFAMRFPNVACAVLALALLYPLGRRLDGPPTARLAMFLVVLSPFWLMYARTARYYALTALVGLAATLAFLAVLRRPTVGRWAAYGVATALLPYTNYIAGVLVLAQALYLFWARPGRRWLLTWAGVVMAAGLAFLPWLPVWRAQTALLAAAAPADLAVSPLGLALKLGFPFLSFTAGETTFPWEAPALISYAALSFLFARGLLALARPGRRAALIVIWLALPVLATALILTFVTPTIPFITVGYRLLFAFPYAVLPMAAGLSRLGRAGRAGLLAALVLA
ncbi:MAG: glycosyltransferase family 39 protein, partial [Anaerolineales bacterium]|nr:glycosyltransferase family 39 protein [Anaerolineales bacterium]